MLGGGGGSAAVARRGLTMAAGAAGLGAPGAAGLCAGVVCFCCCCRGCLPPPSSQASSSSSSSSLLLGLRPPAICIAICTPGVAAAPGAATLVGTGWGGLGFVVTAAAAAADGCSSHSSAPLSSSSSSSVDGALGRIVLWCMAESGVCRPREELCSRHTIESGAGLRTVNAVLGAGKKQRAPVLNNRRHPLPSSVAFVAASRVFSWLVITAAREGHDRIEFVVTCHGDRRICRDQDLLTRFDGGRPVPSYL